MQSITRRLSSLTHLARPLLLTFIGVVLLSLGVAYLFIHAYRTIEGLPEVVYWVTLQFLPRPLRGVLLLAAGLGTLFAGIWQLSGVVVIPLSTQPADSSDELVVGFRRKGPPRIVVLSGGAGMLVLSSLSEHVERLTCVVPVQDPVEYYYRASGLFNFENVYYVVPTPTPLEVVAELDDQSRIDVRRISLEPQLAPRHVAQLHLQHVETSSEAPQLARLAAEAIREADAIILGPGSLYESVLPNFLIDELREAVRSSPARKIYICNLMTEPGRTTGYSVADHIREIRRYAGVAPDYVLVNAQRIEADISRIYAAAHQSPIYLAPEEYEETAVLPGDAAGQRRLVIEGSIVIEADLSSSVIQYTASLSNPSESKAVRVLRHDGQKLSLAILELIRRT